MDKVIVALDRSPLGERALPVAQAVARHERVPIELVTVAPASERTAAAAYLDTVGPLLSGVPVTGSVVVSETGRPVAESLRELVAATGASLLCMSTHGRSGLGAVLIGSTAEDLLRRVEVPVLMVGRGCALPWPGHRRGLLVPLDGSERAEAILDPVVDLAGRSGLEPVLVQVSRPRHAADPGDEGVLERARGRLFDAGFQPKTDHRFAVDPAQAIDEAASTWGAALIVMASYVTPGAPRAFLGSVTMSTVHRAPCPVLVYPGTSFDPVPRGDSDG